MHRGKVPGIVFPEQLVRQMEQEEQTGNHEARLVRSAKMICVLQGLGFSGVHLGGNRLNFDHVSFILDTASELSSKWNELREEIHYPVPETWYYYKPTRPGTCGKTKTKLYPGRLYRHQRPHKVMHRLLFSPPNISSLLFGRICKFCAQGRTRQSFIRTLEQWIKGFLFYCRMCGDCTLTESTYICPQSGCPKKLLNGPCGGSRNMTCEVFPDRYCFWVRVYDRMEPSANIEKIGKLPILPPKNWALDQTCSWINFYTGKDHYKLKKI
jgi:methylenetetrahydrofolate reductase (NADPH)